MSALRALLRTEWAVFTRDKIAFFFTFLFPLIFILIFGFLMGDIDEESATLGLFVPDDVASAVLEETLIGTGARDIVHYDSPEALAEAVSERRVDFGLAWNGESLRFSYHPNRVQENYAYQQIAEGVAAEFNLRHQGLSPVLPINKVHVGTAASARWFNLMVPGIVAFSILASGLFAVSGHLTSMKERHVLDRMIVTPMPPLALLGAIVIIRLVVVYLSTLVTLMVSLALFDLTFSINWFHYTAFVACSTLGMMGFGTLIALVVRRPSSAGNVANALAIVMMFLSGIYFPLELMPSFLRSISKALPLTYMAEAMQFATGVREMSLLRFWAITLSLLGLALILFPVLARYVVHAERR
jgi:ABC-2 type transport system permease protein